jgi:hypothetical protein
MVAISSAAGFQRQDQMSESTHLSRRSWLELSAGWSVAATLGATSLAWAEGKSLKIATFKADVTPPMGHPMCGGWITPATTVDDGLEALGLVITGAGAPIVLCAVDWTGILNSAHVAWRTAIAEAVGTTPDRVAVQCVHQHDAPFVCLSAKQLCSGKPGLENAVVDLAFFEKAKSEVAQAAKAALERLRPLTHIGTGQGKVEKVAGNRRFVNAEGKLYDWRGSGSQNPVHKELPEGLIDPFLKTVAFYDGDTRLAACHYYACHPMSHYGKGAVSSDYVGLARKRTQASDPDCQHMYFTGASGNVAAGKYNDGTPQARIDLTNRIHAAMQASLAGLTRQAIDQVGWQTVEIVPQPRATFQTESLEKLIADEKNGLANRIRPSMMLAWLKRCEARTPIVLSALHVNNASMLHLPAESFIEYQLRGQAAAPDRFVATAAYGDGGPWYIPVAEAYPQGGYEVGVAFSEPTIDELLTGGVTRLAKAKA